MTAHPRHLASNAAPAPRWIFDANVLSVGATDAAVAVLTFFGSAAVFLAALLGVPVVLIAFCHVAVICGPFTVLRRRLRSGDDVLMPSLLLLAVAVSGPLGAGGCAAATLALWLRPPQPERLHGWYDYIAGVDERSTLEKTYQALAAKRLPEDPSAPIERFEPILSGTALSQQQRVLGVIGRRYHSDFHPSLKKALRNSNILIRAQAAAIASVLAPMEKSRLWRRPALTADQPTGAKQIEHLDRNAG